TARDKAAEQLGVAPGFGALREHRVAEVPQPAAQARGRHRVGPPRRCASRFILHPRGEGLQLFSRFWEKVVSPQRDAAVMKVVGSAQARRRWLMVGVSWRWAAVCLVGTGAWGLSLDAPGKSEQAKPAALPAGAVRQLGEVRFPNVGHVLGVAFSPD